MNRRYDYMKAFNIWGTSDGIMVGYRSFIKVPNELNEFLDKNKKCPHCKNLLFDVAIEDNKCPFCFNKIRFHFYTDEDAEKINSINKKYKELSRRTAYMEKTPGFHTESDIEEIWNIQKGQCHFCGTDLGKPNEKWAFERDHLIPVSRGGSDWPLNIALTCRKCNSDKSNSDEVEYWKYLKGIRGGEWYIERKHIVKYFTIKKAALTRRRQKDLQRKIKELEKILNERVQEMDILDPSILRFQNCTGLASWTEEDKIIVDCVENGIAVSFLNAKIYFPPGSHRLVHKIITQEVDSLLDCILKINKLTYKLILP